MNDWLLACMDLDRHCLKRSSQFIASLLMHVPDTATNCPDIIPKMNRQELSVYMLAKMHFDMHQYTQAKALLEQFQPRFGPMRFLQYYAEYMALEQTHYRRQDQPLFSPVRDSSRFSDLLERFHRLYSSASLSDDGYMLYLYGVVLLKVGLNERALEVLIASIRLKPLNWSAWLDLAHCLTPDTYLTIIHPLPECITKHLFLVHMSAEFDRDHQTALAILDRLSDQGGLGRAQFLMAHRAILAYHQRQFHEALALFEQLIEKYPHSVEYMDIYSNILYVMEDAPNLSALAHRCTQLDPYTPQTCLVIGNYYGLKGQHERAIQSFQRALKLDHSYTSAWTLMGHEYIELRNTHAALESYRRALDYSASDYRAWFGLGQTYEMLQMPQFAGWYFRKAVELRQGDGRLWFALGSVLEKQGDLEGAKAVYRRVLAAKLHLDATESPSKLVESGVMVHQQQEWTVQDLSVLAKLGQLEESMGRSDRAAVWYDFFLRLVTTMQRDRNASLSSSTSTTSSAAVSLHDGMHGMESQDTERHGTTTTTTTSSPSHGESGASGSGIADMLNVVMQVDEGDILRAAQFMRAYTRHSMKRQGPRVGETTVDYDELIAQFGQ